MLSPFTTYCTTLIEADDDHKYTANPKILSASLPTHANLDVLEEGGAVRKFVLGSPLFHLVAFGEMRMQRDRGGNNGTEELKVRRARMKEIRKDEYPCLDPLSSTYVWQFASDWGWQSFPLNDHLAIQGAYTEGRR